MDLSPFFACYKNSITGQPPFHPRMMVTLLLDGYCKGVFFIRGRFSRVATDVTNQANDVRQVEPMVEQLDSNTAAAKLDGDVKTSLWMEATSANPIRRP